jgi:hypothetical protein
MERGYYNDEFEELIKQKADQYKMYPSDQVWKGINRSLHTRKKWYWLSFLLFISGISYYAIVQLITPSSNNKKTNTTPNPATQIAANDKNTNNTGKPAAVVPFFTQVTKGSRNNQGAAPSSFVTNPDNFISGETAKAMVATIITIQSIDAVAASNKENTDTESGAENAAGHHGKTISNKILLADRLLTAIPAQDKNNSASFENTALLIFSEQFPVAPPEADQLPVTPEKARLVDAGAAEDENRINWLQQYAVYTLPVSKAKRLSWQLAFAPTMNYRQLRDRDASIPSDVKNKNVPIAQNEAGDPNKLVNHKPALGFELGSHFLYAVNKDLQIKVGAQFNYSRYAIQAYGSYATEVATIALNSTTPGHSGDSLTNFTRISNFGGDVSENLQNQYFQLSIPVGLELRVLGAGKIQIGVAGTVQPTYLINRQTYLITTDYKNYTKEPSLVRRWNVNTGAEIFLAYKSGDLKWQVGPQFRYQLFSSYVKEYPIREFLMEYGIKIAVTKTIR